MKRELIDDWGRLVIFCFELCFYKKEYAKIYFEQFKF